MSRLKTALLVAPFYLFALGATWSEAAGAIASGMILLIAVGAAVLDPGRLRRIPRSIWLALGAYLAAYLLATLLAAPYPSNWRKFLGENWLKLLLVAVPLAVYGRSRHLDRVLKILVGTGALVALYAVWQHFSGLDPVRHRPAPLADGHPMSIGFFGHHLTYGGQVMLLVLVALGWALVGELRREPRWQRAIPWAAVLPLGAALLWSYARSAQIGAAVGIVLLSLSLPGRRRWAALATLAAGLSVALASPSMLHRFTTALGAGGEETRRRLWLSSVHAIAARPWLGFGPGNFQRMMERYRVPGTYDTLAHSHNDLLMHGVNAGLLGMAAALALLGVTLFLFWRARRGMGRLAWIPVTAVAAQLGITVAGLFQVYQTDDEVEFVLYFLLGSALAVVLDHAAAGRKRDDDGMDRLPPRTPQRTPWMNSS